MAALIMYVAACFTRFRIQTGRGAQVDTNARPSRTISVHPYEDDLYLLEHPEVREMLGKPLTVKMLTLHRGVPVCAEYRSRRVLHITDEGHRISQDIWSEIHGISFPSAKMPGVVSSEAYTVA